jgi:hypothetical protein
MHIIVCDKTGNQLSECQFNGSLLDYIKKEAGENYSESVFPYSAQVNGELVPHELHGSVREGEVVVTIEPRDPVTTFLAVVGIISAGYAYYSYKNIPKGYENTQQEQGNSIYSSQIRTNRIRPNQIIREASGKIPIFPDLICPVHRRYEYDSSISKNIEYTYLMLCAGVGYYDLQEDKIKIADTTIDNYAGDITANIYEPGDDVSSDTASEIWYESPDAGDIELKTTPETPSGTWTAVFTATDQIQSFESGSAAAFPFGVDSIFNITSANVTGNEGAYRVDSLSTTTVTNDTATVVKVTYDGSVYTDTTTSITSDSENSVTWEAASGGPNWEGPFTLARDGDTADRIEIDLFFPNGLFQQDSNGNYLDRTVEYQYRYRDARGGGWLETVNQTVTAQIIDQDAITLSRDLTSEIQPQFEIRRVTEDSNDTKIRDKSNLLRVKSRITNPPSSYADVTTLSLKIRASNALSSNAENRVSIVNASRKLPTLAELRSNLENGTSYDLTASANQVLGDAYDVENSREITFTQLEGSPLDYQSMFYSDNGLYLYFTQISGSNRIFWRYTLATAYDPRSLDESTLVTHSQTNISGYYTMMFDSGTKVLHEQTNGNTNVFYLSTPYDITTISSTADDTFTDGGFGGRWAWILGNKLYKSNVTGSVRQYTMSTANDITSASYDSVEESFSSKGSVREFYVYSDKMFVTTESALVRTLHRYSKSSTTIDSPTDDNHSKAYAANERYFNFTNDGGFMTSYSGDDLLSYYDTQVVVDSKATSSPGRFLAYMYADRIKNRVQDFIDWDALASLDATLSARGDELNAEFADETTLWEASKIALSPGYAEPTIRDGVLTPVRSLAGSDYTQLYTPDILINPVVSTAEHDIDEEPDGVIVEYLDSETGITETVDCFLTGDTGIRAKRIQAIGFTDRTRAWRYGMRERERYRYRPQEFRFTTELDAMNSYYGDPVGIVDELDAPFFGKLVSYSAPSITVDQDLTFGSGTHYACFRTDEGDFSGLYTVTAGASANILTLTNPTALDFTPGDNDVYFSFGTLDELVKRAIVRSVEPSEDGIIDVICEEYIAEIYQNDDLSPP